MFTIDKYDVRHLRVRAQWIGGCDARDGKFRQMDEAPF
jgi:hypothetical protein